MSRIISVSTVEPKYRYETKDIIAAADEMWLKNIDPSIRRVALKIFEGAQIQERRSAIPIETVFSDLSFQERNDLYIKATIELGEQVLSKALRDANLAPTDLDFIITTSCTGFMIPSLDAYLINLLGLRGDIIRLPITEMGCAGGTSALIYAQQFAKANPDKHIAIVSVEIPSITFQKNDFSMENLVSTAIFADGASAVIMGPTTKLAPEIVDVDMYHFRDATHLMGYNLQNSGLKIVLDRDVPDKIQENFEKFFFPFLRRNKLEPVDVQHYMFHPGGKKIINAVEDFIGRYGKDITDSKAVLKERGNMSSSTILHILERTLRKDIKPGDYGYMLAFGPGFSGQSLLLRW